MTSTTIWLAIGLSFFGLAVMTVKQGAFNEPNYAPNYQPTVSSQQVLPRVMPPAPEQRLPELKPVAEHKLPSASAKSQKLNAPFHDGGIEVVAGTDDTRLKDYLRDFEASSTAHLKERLASLEQDVEAADYFRRANGGELDYADTMAFDDLLRQQEAIHLILLSRKLERLKSLTAKL